MSHPRFRLPVSTRHAFALAFDLAVRRDPLHSLVIPLLLQTPWILALGVLPPLNEADEPWRVFSVWLAAQIGTFVVWLAISAMLRFRARSVFNTPPDVPPAPALECYSRGLSRAPWLLVTEVVRNLMLVFSTFFFIIPVLFVGFRLSFATEAVVLDEPHAVRAFSRSFKLTDGRFERWLEIIVISVVLVFAVVVLGTVLSFVLPGPGLNAWVAVTQILIAAMLPIIQYAWTFFYLRLVESEVIVPLIEVGPAYAATGSGTDPWTPAAAAPESESSAWPDPPAHVDPEEPNASA